MCRSSYPHTNFNQPYLPGTSDPSPSTPPQNELPDNSDEKMDIFRYDAYLAFYPAVVRFHSASSTRPVETQGLALARLDVCITSVIDLFRRRKSRKGRRQKENSDIFGKLHRSATTSLEGAVRERAGYWRSEKVELHAQSNSIELCKKVVLEMISSAAHILILLPLSRTFLAIKDH